MASPIYNKRHLSHGKSLTHPSAGSSVVLTSDLILEEGKSKAVDPLNLSLENQFKKEVETLSNSVIQAIDRFVASSNRKVSTFFHNLFHPTFDSLILDEKIYFFDSAHDLTEEQRTRLSTLIEKQWFEIGNSPILNSFSPPNGFSEKDWTSFVISLKNNLENIQERTTFIDTKKFAHRLPDQLKAAVAKVKPLQSNAGSTYSKGLDEPPDEPDLAIQYILAYGVDQKDIQPVDETYSPFPPKQVKNCNVGRDHSTAERFIQMKDYFMISSFCLRPFHEVEQEENEGKLFNSIINPTISQDTSNKGPSPKLMKNGAAVAFLKKYQPQIEQAITVLSRNHPDIHKENLTLFYDQLIQIEIKQLDKVDLAQDICAAKFAQAPQSRLELFKKYFQKSWYTEAAFSDWGVSIWKKKMKNDNVPIDIQAFGPLQIIVGLARSAYQNKELFQTYSAILTDDDFKDEKAILRSILDPEKMFAIKAMTWDIQLRELKKLPASITTVDILSAPHINNEMAREYFLLQFAHLLVQYPERIKEELESKTAFTNPGYALSYLINLGENLNIELKFPGTKYFKQKKCPPRTLTFLEKEGNKICLSVNPPADEVLNKKNTSSPVKDDKSFLPLSWFFKTPAELHSTSLSSFQVVQKAMIPGAVLSIHTDVALRYDDYRYNLTVNVSQEGNSNHPPLSLFHYSAISSDPQLTRLKITNSLKIKTSPNL